MNHNVGCYPGKELLCYFHLDGDFVTNGEGQVRYRGGRVVVETVKEEMSFEDLKALISVRSGYDRRKLDIKYTLKYDRMTLVDLDDDSGIKNFVLHNDIIGHVYISLKRNISKANERNDEEMAELETFLGLSEEDMALFSPTTNVNNYDSSGCEDTFLECLTYEGNSGTHDAASRIGCDGRSTIVQRNYNTWSTLFHGVGQIIEDAELFRTNLYKFSVAHNFKYKFVKNSKDRLRVRCEVEGCPWKLVAYAVGKGCSSVRVTTFINEHSHSAQDNLQVRQGKRGSLTASLIIDEVRNNGEKRPTEIRKTLQTDFGISLTYKQAYRAKEKAMEEINGRPRDSYMLIPWICRRLKETDDKTIAEWTAGPNNRFQRVFIAYGCCIEGFLAGARPILYVDGTHLSGPYKGTLLAASAYDADNEMFPFAIGIVKAETDADWTWFMAMIKNIVGSMMITIVSDRHNAIIGAVKHVFGGDRHAYCYRHIKENFSKEWLRLTSGKRSRSKSREDALMLLDKIAWARSNEDYDNAVGELKNFSPQLVDWLNSNGDVEKWALSKFPHPRWDNITTNIAESFNAWMVKERKHNVAQMIHEHREKVAKKLHASSVAMTKWKTCIGPKIETILMNNVAVSKRFFCVNYGGGLLNVHTSRGDHRVDLGLLQCSCKEWQMTGIPCRHACAAVDVVKGNIYDYVDDCYKLETQMKIYGRCMVPMVTIDMPNVNAYMLESTSDEIYLLPPITSRPPGRPRTARIESQRQNKRIYHCMQCHQAGHTRRTCKNPNPATED